ncbi:MAG: helix-turn-helix domain-containing protein, partial [Gemmataceae bacterium]|nr:helix-turn-helix domain-containing protein [Gemmataceae bacterium]
MVHGFYDLTEAAQALGMSEDELRQMAQKNQIRSFQDRGTLRFRQADIQELARRRGATSDPDMILAEPKSTGPRTPSTPRSGTQPKSGPQPRSGVQPKSGPKSPPRTPSKQATADAPEVFDFALDTGDDAIDIGREHLSDLPGKSGKKLASGSDSDVKLVADISSPDSDVKLVSETGPRTPKAAGQRKSQLSPTSPAPKKSSRLAGGPPQADSGVRLVTGDSDSDVKIVGPEPAHDEVPLGQQPPPSATDSDIRLEHMMSPRLSSSDEMNLTEEINLDEEIKKQEAAQKQTTKARVRPKSELKFPTQSPFELSDSDLNAPTETSNRPSSSDFELTPQGVKDDSDGSIVLEPSSDEYQLEASSDAEEKPVTGPSSGINLSKPADAGISLEEDSTSDFDLDLSLEVDDSASKTSKKEAVADDSSSEFELTLDGADEGGGLDSDSE